MLANTLWWIYAAIASQEWRQASKDISLAQRTVLKGILRANARTAFGRKYHFDRIESVADFQALAPIQSYEDCLPYIEQIANGETAVLTHEAVDRFGISSGTSSASKLIPYTPSLVKEFQKGILPWAFHLFRTYPRLLATTSYWSVTPIGAQERLSPGGIPIGFDDDRAYLDHLTRWVMETSMPAPSELARLDDMETFRYATLRLLLQQEDLGWVSVWNPTFLSLLLEPLTVLQAELLSDLSLGTVSLPGNVPEQIRRSIQAKAKRMPGRAAELSKIFGRWKGLPPQSLDANGDSLYQAIWPSMQLISCWADGSAKEVIPLVQACFPKAAIQPKGLLATEGFVSFPVDGHGSALSGASHFFEFEEVDLPEQPIRTAEQLKTGARYSVILTTSGGLYRYRLGDIVEVTGFTKTCPLLRFVCKQERVVDLRGEKLDEKFVQSCVQEVMADSRLDAAFWMVAPHHGDKPDASYVLFLQLGQNSSDSTSDLDSKLDAALRANFHYDYCRRLGQLDKCKVFFIDPSSNAANVYLSTCAQLGQRLGNIKHVALHASEGWDTAFEGVFLSRL